MASKSAAITFPVVLMPRSQLASTFEFSAWAAPWVRRGTKFTIPPLPVVLATPVPVRLNQISIVNVARSSLAGSPKVTYAPPLPRSRPFPAAACVVMALGTDGAAAGPLDLPGGPLWDGVVVGASDGGADAPPPRPGGRAGALGLADGAGSVLGDGSAVGSVEGSVLGSVDGSTLAGGLSVGTPRSNAATGATPSSAATRSTTCTVTIRRAPTRSRRMVGIDMVRLQRDGTGATRSERQPGRTSGGAHAAQGDSRRSLGARVTNRTQRNQAGHP